MGRMHSCMQTSFCSFSGQYSPRLTSNMAWLVVFVCDDLVPHTYMCVVIIRKSAKYWIR